MAKELVSNKIILELVNDEFDRGLILYKIKIDGVLDNKQKSLSINNMGFSLINLAEIISIIIEKTKEQEGIGD
ncbi:hypothetical protein FJZ33_00205 [Candidatus Poribacteria bacterium]|nr:hypothetical protein [Candidatus Poribacteria bacterium]